VLVEQDELELLESKCSNITIVTLYSAYTFVAKDPQFIRIGGRVVELAEKQYLKKIEEFLSKDIKFEKVPGPWKDQPREQDYSDESNQKLMREKEEQLDHLYQGSVDYKKKRLHAHWERIRKANLRRGIHVDMEEVRKEHPLKLKERPESIGNFRQGRFSDVVQEFDAKRAAKQGIDPKTVYRTPRKHATNKRVIRKSYRGVSVTQREEE
jgi:hypothetical protein